MYHGAKMYASVIACDVENLVIQLIVTRFTPRFWDVLNYLQGTRMRRTWIIILIIQQKADTYMKYTWLERYELLQKVYDKNTRFLGALKMRCLGSQRSVRAHIRYQMRRHDALSRECPGAARGNNEDASAGLAGEREKYSNHRRGHRKPLRASNNEHAQQNCSPRLSVRWNHPPLKHRDLAPRLEIFDASRNRTKRGKERGKIRLGERDMLNRRFDGDF